MEILFLSKTTDWCNKAKFFLKEKNENTKVFQGKFGDKFPTDLKDWKGDYIISFLSPWIIPEDILKNTRKKAINFHPGTPKYGGIGCYNFAIYNEEKEYGVLCHKITKDIDSGKIIKIRYFPIDKNETVLSLKQKSMENLLELYYEIINMIINNEELPFSEEKWQRKPYTKKDLQSLCRITLDMPKEEIKKRFRATYYPDGPDYPYIEIKGKKIVLKETQIDELENSVI